MSTIRRTAPKAPPTTSKPSRTSGCGPMTPTERAMSSCGGWTVKATRTKSTAKTSGGKKKAETAKPNQKAATGGGCGWSPSTRGSRTVSACGGAGWTRYGRLPSGC